VLVVASCRSTAAAPGNCIGALSGQAEVDGVYVPLTPQPSTSVLKSSARFTREEAKVGAELDRR
jgi:hypothetical protein